MFDSLAQVYAPFAEITHAAYRPWVERVVPARGGRAIELGCGSGQFLGLLAERFDEVVAVDMSAAMIGIARQRNPQHHIDYRIGDIRDTTPDRVGTFDLVFSVNTLHHLADPQLHLAQVRELLRPGGTVVIIDYVATTPGWAATIGPAYRLYRWTRGLHGAVRTGITRRSLKDAQTMYRLRRDPRWRELAASAAPLQREQFHRHYTDTFPGAHIVGDLDPSVYAMAWTHVDAGQPANIT